jgi:GDP-D-mannose 3', 5'-epimerase
MKCLVLGASGFLGSAITKKLIEIGHDVTEAYRGRDGFKRPGNVVYCDLHIEDQAKGLLDQGWDEVYQFAGESGGTIRENRYDYMMNNLSININVLKFQKDIDKIFFPSSAWVYQKETNGYFEQLALPYNPSNLYGWEKAIGEMLYEKTFKTVVGRIHNVYGPGSPFDGEKALAPAALSYQILKANEGDSIRLYGDGTQERSFLYIDDFVDCVMKLMHDCESNKKWTSPVNIGSEDPISINTLAKKIIELSGKDIKIVHGGEPIDIRRRVSENWLLRRYTLGWEPSVSFDNGIERTFNYVKKCMGL